VRDPRDPKNPYLGQYADYDAWIYAQAYEQAKTPGYIPPDYQGYALEVDADGWPVPLRVSGRRDLEDDGRTPKPHCDNLIQAYGIMGQTMQEEMDADQLATRAASLPRIPQWLAQQPPAAALVLPGGEVVTRGPLGGAADSATQGHPAYYRYSADGQELGHTAAGAEWWTLYFQDFAKLKQQHPDSYWEEDLGCVLRLESASGQPRAVYDYHGTKLPGVKPPLDRAPKDYTWLGGSELPGLYTCQQGGPHRRV
jgi:hypothetical protein